MNRPRSLPRRPWTKWRFVVVFGVVFFGGVGWIINVIREVASPRHDHSFLYLAFSLPVHIVGGLLFGLVMWHFLGRLDFRTPDDGSTKDNPY